MKLRNKIIIVLGLAWLLFLGLIYMGSNHFLMQGFLALEEERTDRDLDRVDQALDQINHSLSTFALDWSHWNELYHYMEGKNPSFISNNMIMPAFVNARINLISYWDNHHKIIFGSGVDTANQKIISYPHGLEKYIFPDSPLFNRKDVNKDLRGYVLTDNGIMLISAAAITDGDKKFPPLGVSMIGRHLSAELIDIIRSATKTDITLLLPKEISTDHQLQYALDHAVSDNKGHYSITVAHNSIKGYSVIRDVLGEPIGMLQMTTSRPVYSMGKESVRYFLMLFVIVGILFSILLWWLLRILIVTRLERLNDEVSYISNQHAIKQRVFVDDSDELSAVSVKINHMLDIIQAAQEQLESRVEVRTQELQKTNIQLQNEISERKSIERELTVHKEHLIRLAHYDSLTALPNRVFFNEILNKVINHAKRENKKFAILFIDLDRFKSINDALGHSFGDQVLKEMSRRFSSLLNPGDILARLGGDEFIVLLNNIEDYKYVDIVAEKILTAAGGCVALDGHDFFIGASIGISVYPEDGNSLEVLQKNADIAMYKAKHDGGGGFVYYTAEMNKLASEKIKMEAALRRAILNNEFVLYFQPQLSLKDGVIRRMEALIRWEDPLLGLINPGSFIPLAEETGLILPIGGWALHEACRINKKWQDAGYEPVTIAVNISPKQFKHQDVAQIVKDALTINNLSPDYLEVEVTESAVMDNVEDAIAKLQSIRDMGVHIAVDDFGTGYTSINYLRQYPISILKIDQTFIKGLPDSQSDMAITGAVISLGHNLGLEVVAEGVETAEQMEYLADQGCDLIQGYFLSRPLPESKVIDELIRPGRGTKHDTESE